MRGHMWLNKVASVLGPLKRKYDENFRGKCTETTENPRSVMNPFYNKQ